MLNHSFQTTTMSHRLDGEATTASGDTSVTNAPLVSMTGPRKPLVSTSDWDACPSLWASYPHGRHALCLVSVLLDGTAAAFPSTSGVQRVMKELVATHGSGRDSKADRARDGTRHEGATDARRS